MTARTVGVAAAFVDGAIVRGDVSIRDGRIDAVGVLPAGRSGLAVAGFVDLQVNGYAGVDLLTSGRDDWQLAAQAMARDGVTAYVANLITSAEPMVTAALHVAADVRRSEGCARLLGAHLEGPFLSPLRSGTHPPEHLHDPDAALVERLSAAGPVVGITLAPELPGALAVITALAARGVLVSLGHSDATGAEAAAGFDAGARTVTHLFNAMSTPTAREPGLTGVALTRADVAPQLLCDGVHLGREAVQLALAAARDRFVLVTDALAAAGAPDGDYLLGSVPITRAGAYARRGDGTLAGSVLTMADAVRQVVAWGARLEDALAAATSRPASLLGRADIGRLFPGARADVVVLDDDLTVTHTLLGGVPV